MNRCAPSARPRAAALLLATALAAACAMGGRREAEPPPDVVREDKARIEDARRSITRLEEQVGALWASATPDCESACHLAANICELAKQICAIASRNPTADPIAAKCTDARGRCERAAATTVERCGCRQPP